jgi:Holliday junction resolvase RusA-like endonuclease
MTLLEFQVPGAPVAQPRGRATRYGAKGAVRIYNPPGRSRAWRALVSVLAREAKRRAPAGPAAFPMQGPVGLVLRFNMPRPGCHFVARNPKRPLRTDAPELVDVKPDLDNLEKAVLDALTDARVWRDDAQVARVTKEKLYTAGQPGLAVTVVAL